MSKRLISLLLAICLLVSMVPFSAVAETAGEDAPTWEYTVSAGKATLTKYNGSATDVYIPATIDDHPVAKLGDGLFQNNDGLNSVTLGTGILEIGAKAFYDCDNMVCALVSEELTTIGDEAFFGCDNFNSIILYDAITTIGTNAFGECPKLTLWCNENTAGHTYATANGIPYEILNPSAEPETVVQNGITYYIMNGEAIAVSFDGSSSSVTIPTTVNNYPVTELRETFKNNTAVTSITISSGPKIISDSAFERCSNLQTVLMHEGVTHIGAKAFYLCKKLTTVSLPESVEIIGANAFEYCSALKSIALPKNLKAINRSLFIYCYALESVTIPNGVTTIEDHAFDGCSLKQITLPESLTHIGSSAFYGCDLTSITIPNSVTSLGGYAFNFCQKLETVQLSSGLTQLKSSTFKDCHNLTTITLPDGMLTIKKAFENCQSLKTLRIPKSVTSIEADALPWNAFLIVYEDSYAQAYADSIQRSYAICDGSNEPDFITQDGVTYYLSETEATVIDCDFSVTTAVIPQTIGGKPVTEISGAFMYNGALQTVTLPNGLKTISPCAFYDSGITTLEIPDTVTEIGESAFKDCNNLKTVNIPDGITAIKYATFDQCRALESIVIPNGVKSIGEVAFRQCMQLKEVTIPDSVTEIGSSAFYNCEDLTTLVIGNGISIIPHQAFYACGSLTSALIGTNVITISKQAFDECDKLKKLILSKKITSISNDAFHANTCLLVYKNSYAHNYAKNNGRLFFLYDGTAEPDFAEVDGVTYCILNNEAIAINYNGSAAELTIPKTVNGAAVTELREAFYNCRTLTKVTLPEGLKIIGDNAFGVCTNLTEINIPNSVTTIGNSAFQHCSKLGSITIPTGVQSIGTYTFKYCNALRQVTIPGQLTTIPEGMFNECEYLNTVTIQEGVKIIGTKAFQDCIRLRTVSIPESTTTIQNAAFSGCRNLDELKLPESITAIEALVFNECRALKKINIPGKITVLKGSTFRNCVNLTSIVIPESITKIDGSAFSGCSKLSEIQLPSQLNTINDYAFDGCTSIHQILIPRSVTWMMENSFAGNTILLVYEDSYAHTYAAQKNLLYFVLRNNNNPETAYGTGIAGTVEYTDGSAAAGATVEIFYDDGVLKEAVTADESGNYAFTYAEVGRYTVKATDSSGRTASTALSVKRMNVFDVFLVGDAALTLKKGWAVSGTVSEAATVTLTDQSGSVIATTEGSSFNFTDISNGTYILKAETEAGSIAKEVTVFDRNVSGIELIIATNTATIWGYVEVEDREFNRHRRNWVQITIYNDDGLAVDQCKSDGDGKYTFKNLPVGEYTIVAETAEMRPDKHHHYDRNHTLTGYAYVNAAEVGIHQAETIVLREENDALATVSGKVTAQGETQDCRVTLRNVFRHEVAVYTTGKNGKYTFNNVKDGLYIITAVTQSDGMGQAVIVVRDGEVYGDTDIFVLKSSKITKRHERFKQEVPACKNRQEAIIYKDRIIEEKRFYDSLSEDERLQLPQEYIDRLNKLTEWIAEVEYTTTGEATVEQGGLVISGDELEAESTVTFNLTVEKVAAGTISDDGVNNQEEFIQQAIEEAAGENTLQQYYEISMTKTVDGVEKGITSVYKDTDASGKFRITLPIPEEYRGYKHYSVVHIHHGEAVTLTDLDDDPDTVTFEVDRFSTFALSATNTELICDHIYTAQVTPATCVTDGYTTHTCSKCQDEYTDAITRAAGHTPAGDPIVVNSTCSEAGSESGYCTVCRADYTVALPKPAHTYENGCCTGCGMAELRSAHTYSHSMDQTWTHTEQDATSVTLTFSDQTELESGNDYLYLYDKNGTEIGRYTGTELAGRSITVDGNTVTLRMVTDDSVSYFGFEITDIDFEFTTSALLVRILRFIIGMNTHLKLVQADMNGDGSITITDAVLLLRSLAQ